MTAAILITICSLLLVAYVFDLTSSRTRIPSVILLLLLGWVVKQATGIFNIALPDLTNLLPFIGTLGLILIVLEGTLELELNQAKAPLIKKSIIAALIPLLLFSLLAAFFFQWMQPGISFRDALTNAIPLSIISSAIAIPSTKYLQKHNREFIIYESSLSDIFGVIYFNFVALNALNESHSFVEASLQLVVMVVGSFAATILLAFLLGKINHPIKFVPIILLVVLIYSIAKVYHLPALIFILILGLFLGNLDELQRLKRFPTLDTRRFNSEVMKFKELIGEATFLIRALFFLLFGYLMETADILDEKTFLLSAGIVAAILIMRAIQFKISGIPLLPMLFIIPRGLINILLFLSIVPAQNIPIVNRPLLLQVILLSALVMMFGLMGHKAKPDVEEGHKTNQQTT